MLVTCEEMKSREEAAFARGVQAEDLMEEAGRGVAEIVRQFHEKPAQCVVFCGKGHNGGDALVAARHLQTWGWSVDVRFSCSETDLAPLTAKKLTEWRQVAPSSRTFHRGLVVLDGLLGSGAQGEPQGEVAEAIASINRLRRESGAWVLAIDVPTGLNADTGVPAEVSVEADLTAVIALVKQGLVADSATNHVGRIAVVPLAELTGDAGDSWKPACSWDMRSWLPPRGFDIHKGECGRVGIVAGSLGYLGAARLCSAAAVKAGAGLVTLYAKPDIHPLLAGSCLPEVMVKPVKSYQDALNDPLDAIAIGPGLGPTDVNGLLTVIRKAPQPMVVDADALNAFYHDTALLRHCRGPRLLTPHPGEMERLFQRRDRTRAEWLESFLSQVPVTLLLKGSRTLIGTAGGGRSFNTTGNPGMATGGIGDVLTGVAAALTAQMKDEDLRRRLDHAAILSSWLTGRAAEVAVFNKGGSPESLTATAVIENLADAFHDLRTGAY